MTRWIRARGGPQDGFVPGSKHGKLETASSMTTEACSLASVYETRASSGELRNDAGSHLEGSGRRIHPGNLDPVFSIDGPISYSSEALGLV